MTEEDRLQIEAAELLDRLRVVWCHVPNGGKRHLFEAKKFRRMGVKPGVPDILIFTPPPAPVLSSHVGMAIELKIGSNKPTETQKQWARDLSAQGWLCATVWGWDAFLSAVKGSGYL